VNLVGSTFNIQNSISYKSQKPKAVAEINRPIEFQRGTVGATESAKEGTRVLTEGSDIGLGSRDRAFESPHSDQNPLKSVDFRGFFLFASETAGSAGGGIPQKSFSFKHRAQRANREESSDSFKREVEEASPVYGLRGG